MKDNLDSLRLEYMTIMASIAHLAVERDTHIVNENMGLNTLLQSPEEIAASKNAVEDATRQIVEGCNNLRDIEKRAQGNIGILALFDMDVPNSIRVALAILVGKATSGAWIHETRYLGTLLQPAGGSNPEDLLIVRESFRKSGLLRSHTHCDSGRTLEELSDLVLTETSYRKLLALEPDSECDELAEARKLVALSGKRR